MFQEYVAVRERLQKSAVRDIYCGTQWHLWHFVRRTEESNVGVCWFAISYPVREYIAQIKTTPLPMKSCKIEIFAPSLWPLSRFRSLSCHIYFDTAPRLFQSWFCRHSMAMMMQLYVWVNNRDGIFIIFCALPTYLLKYNIYLHFNYMWNM